METNFEIKDTKSLQIKSVNEFAGGLGYFLSRNGFFMTLPEVSGAWEYCDKNIISFKTMVMLHNHENYDNHGREYERFGFDLHKWNKAKSAKIVQNVNLTANKKKKSIHCHKHLVKFVKPYYEQMFLK